MLIGSILCHSRLLSSCTGYAVLNNDHLSKSLLIYTASFLVCDFIIQNGDISLPHINALLACDFHSSW